jgi:histone H3/H4
MTELPKAPLERLLRLAGAERVSEEAASAMADILSEYGMELGVQAKMLANHAGRKTVTAEDVKLAASAV